MKLTDHISEHFIYEEVIYSSLALQNNIDNSLPSYLFDNVLYTALQAEKIRAILGNNSMHIDSWYRCFALDALLNPTKPGISQHCEGEAIDFKSPTFGSPYNICKAIYKSDVIFDQLILEPSWVHCSFTKEAPRKQVLTRITRNGTVRYIPGLSKPLLED